MINKSVPIQTLHLFPVLDKLLIELLKSLSPEDWNKPTLARLWTVKDIAAHLLDTNMRTISSGDGYSGKGPENINSYSDLVNYLNELNANWVKAMDRVSPQQLIYLLEITGGQYTNQLTALDPFVPAKVSVLWAGEEKSDNWFHIAREYTEKWHHQQQIREAVNKPGLISRELFYPCMDTFMRGLPHTYRDVIAEAGTLIEINIPGDAGGTWYLQKKETGWILTNDDNKGNIDASITIKPGIAWKLFTKGVAPDYAIERSIIKGDDVLAKKAFHMIAVMA